jgi:hypothetical protein
MTVIDKLACSLGRRDEVPNQELARKIAARNDKDGVEELVENLHNKSKDIQSDCVKALYEIGVIKPSLIWKYAADFVSLLDSKNNRLQWGAMTALNTIATEVPKTIYGALPKLAAIAEKGTVITKDNYIGIIIKLYSIKEFADDSFQLLNEQLMTALPNQLPMYAEMALPFITDKHKPTFIKTLNGRLDDFEKESKRKRVEKVLKKLSGK